MTPLLYGPDNRPLSSSSSVAANTSYGVHRKAGGHSGTLANWMTFRMNRDSEPYERSTIASRAQDLVANDPHAANIVDSMGVSVVGTGLRPQSRPNWKLLGWSEEQAETFQTQAEWAFSIWETEADAAGRLPFWAIQFLSVQSLVVNGEFLRIPVMKDKPGRTFSLALQCVNPLRMYTPSDLTQDTSIRDGVTLGEFGEPSSYWIANPDNAYTSYSLPSASFAQVPAWVGHRPGVFHSFIQKEDEQVRGISLLAPGMKFFRDLNDYLDFELVGAIVAASFPVFIKTPNAEESAPPLNGDAVAAGELTRHQDVAAGTMIYGNPGEEPHVLESKRPGNTFPEFVERILRGIGATVGMPYEVVAKDFSKTNYSSARAALLEAWRVFGFYQKWLVDSFCQKVWEMVLEEAWLRGMITLPAGSPDWYEARHAYTRAMWIPPERDDVDPLKTARANQINRESGNGTLAKIAARQGMDVDSYIEQLAREKRKLKAAGLLPEEPATPETKKDKKAKADAADALIEETEQEEEAANA
ncbi:phage portal protein [Desulfoluna spongiiphila]|uniref:Phage portal protein, lambda family n=1 Tax=Desulfoluna spongiiphila TaxID=419481 RepID=A0A1G5CG45_9BACT|nr:phage portal protein [Desulfoluna spongiiphila]SCY01495.1 phage portal protein, lambda family [Desulfoluna spongiiphila]